MKITLSTGPAFVGFHYSEHKLDAERTRRVVKFYVVDVATKNEILQGQSECSVKDKFVRSIGRRTPFSRGMQAPRVSYEDKSAIRKWYETHVKDSK